MKKPTNWFNWVQLRFVWPRNSEQKACQFLYPLLVHPVRLPFNKVLNLCAAAIRKQPFALLPMDQ